MFSAFTVSVFIILTLFYDVPLHVLSTLMFSVHVFWKIAHNVTLSRACSRVYYSCSWHVVALHLQLQRFIHGPGDMAKHHTRFVERNKLSVKRKKIDQDWWQAKGKHTRIPQRLYHKQFPFMYTQAWAILSIMIHYWTLPSTLSFIQFLHHMSAD